MEAFKRNHNEIPAEVAAYMTAETEAFLLANAERAAADGFDKPEEWFFFEAGRAEQYLEDKPAHTIWDDFVGFMAERITEHRSLQHEKEASARRGVPETEYFDRLRAQGALLSYGSRLERDMRRWPGRHMSASLPQVYAAAVYERYARAWLSRAEQQKGPAALPIRRMLKPHLEPGKLRHMRAAGEAMVRMYEQRAPFHGPIGRSEQTVARNPEPYPAGSRALQQPPSAAPVEAADTPSK